MFWCHLQILFNSDNIQETYNKEIKKNDDYLPCTFYILI